MPSYAICSSKTQYFWLNTGSKDGETLATDNSASEEQTILTVDKPIETISLVYITNEKGLYVGLPDDHPTGTKLIWTSKPFQWEVVRTGDGHFEIFVPGQDRYAFDNWSIPRVVEVQTGSTSVGGDLNWAIKML